MALLTACASFLEDPSNRSMPDCSGGRGCDCGYDQLSGEISSGRHFHSTLSVIYCH